MKKIAGFFIVLVLLAVALVGFYLRTVATKADVWSWEHTYNISLPLWMKSLPETTGQLSQFIDKKRKDALQELGEVKEDKQAEFNAWLTGLENQMKEAARQKAHDMIDEQFRMSGSSSGNK